MENFKPLVRSAGSKYAAQVADNSFFEHNEKVLKQAYDFSFWDEYCKLKITQQDPAPL